MGSGVGVYVAGVRTGVPCSPGSRLPAEFDAACVEKHRTGALKDFNVLVGDQGDPLVLDGWIDESGGSFDVVIDDGGHRDCQIWTSFLKLWPMVKSGGLYFIEDMQVAKWRQYNQYSSSLCDKGLNVPDKLKEIVDDLIYDMKGSEIDFIYCQREACVIGKKWPSELTQASTPNAH